MVGHLHIDSAIEKMKERGEGGVRVEDMLRKSTVEIDNYSVMYFNIAMFESTVLLTFIKTRFVHTTEYSCIHKASPLTKD